MKRVVLCLVLSALPLSAHAAVAPSCTAPPRAAGLAADLVLPSAHQVLPLEQRLFHRLSGGGEEGLEVRFLVAGAPYLVEEVDLVADGALRFDGGAAVRRHGTEAPDRAARLGGARVIELLALRPDLVRELHERARGGTRVEVELREDGRPVESLPFAELVRRSAELRESPVEQLAVRSRVSGAGAGGGVARRTFAASTYLEDCSLCTWETPCDTDCGYDPWKGGPVTCGEYGVCTPDPCSCETVVSEHWTDWYPVRSYSGGFLQCYRVEGGGSNWHEDWWTEYRRDRIRRTLVCPSCPSCSGCYYVEESIDYQLTSAFCWRDTGWVCGFGDPVCCSRLCVVFPWTACESTC